MRTVLQDVACKSINSTTVGMLGICEAEVPYMTLVKLAVELFPFLAVRNHGGEALPVKA